MARRERDGALNAWAMTLPRSSDTVSSCSPVGVADALQLPAAFVAAERRPPSLEMVTLDECLANAARREGFAMIDLTPVD